MNQKLLIIEDDLFIRDLYLHVFKNAGYQVSVAQDGEEGVSVAQQVLPEIILLDVMLPKKNGVEVLKALKDDEHTKNIPVLMLTNLADDNVVSDAFRLGAQGYLIKTRYTPYEMVKQVDTFLQNPTGKVNEKV